MVQQGLQLRIVDRAPVVRIDQAQVPHLRALIEIGDAGRRDLDERLGQAVPHAALGDLRRERAEVCEKPRATHRVQHLPHEVAHGLFPRRIRVQPAAVAFRFAQRFRHVVADALDEVLVRVLRGLEGPGAEQRLVQQVFLVAIGRRMAVHHGVVTLVRARPAPERRPPGSGHLREHADTRAHVFAAFRVVRRGRRERRGPLPLPLGEPAMQVAR